MPRGGVLGDACTLGLKTVKSFLLCSRGPRAKCNLSYYDKVTQMNINLELSIDQPIAGHFYWTIVCLGQAGDAPRVVDYSRGPMPTRGLATAAGLAALMRHQEVGADLETPASRLRSDPIAEAARRFH